MLSVLHARGISSYHWGYSPENEEAMSWLQKAIDKGYPEAVAVLEKITKEKERKEEIVRLKTAAESGDVKAMTEYGFMIWDGKVNGVCIETALEMLAKAGEAGVVEAQLRIGRHYGDKWRRAVAPFSWPPQRPEDYEKAVYWYSKSAEAGNPEAIDRLESLRIESEGIKIFETITFGGYTWLILDRQEDKVLLLAEEIIERLPYHQSLESFTWETCTLRTYLNSEFLQKFTSEQQSQILEIKNNNPPNIIFKIRGGNDTCDKVFLLSLEELDQYFNYSGNYHNKELGDYERFSEAYNKARKAIYMESARGWWLRSPGDKEDRVAAVENDGKVYVIGWNAKSDNGIRPAVWLKL